jgi:hypothetical protein
MTYAESFERWIDPATIDWFNTLFGMGIVVVLFFVFLALRGHSEIDIRDVGNASESTGRRHGWDGHWNDDDEEEDDDDAA